MNTPNELQWTLIVLAAAFVALLLVSRRWATNYARTVVLIGVGTVMLLPFAWLVCAAFKDAAVLNDYTFLPPVDKISNKTVNLKNFETLLGEKQTVQGPVNFWRYVANSLFLASAGTFISLVFSSMGGYALAKYRFAGRGPLITFMLASMTIPGVVLLAPNFEIIWRLGWMDTYKALLVPGCVSAFGIFLFRQAIIGVPNDLIEAGRIDGCSEFRIYMTLIMPLVRPMTGAFCLISFLGAWNAFLGPNIFLQSQQKLTLPVVLNQYIGEYSQQYGVFLAGTLLAIIPPAVLFLSLQREFIGGLTSGAVKQ
ncbi:MAG TPA: carbohydrate ABC transporter permease [Tepidisphaeraceae bacterium]|jgi:ABC-type glycerol-3-phosphate transport system permease component|nr:carbohydrate ABC transporter permease [Tepidisphaeraceae bacterium]